ncbi:MAG: gp53-like domain-containing protein, partial [Cetobacterium somerae]
QLFSKHSFHELYSVGDETSVYSHAYPNGYDLTASSPWTQYVLRTKSKGDGFDQYIFGNNSITINGANIGGTIAKESDGWVKFPNGLIIQWVSWNGQVGSSVQDVYLPLQFTSGTFKVSGNVVSTDGSIIFVQLSPTDTNKVVVRYYSPDGNSRPIIYGGSYTLIAVGY